MKSYQFSFLKKKIDTFDGAKLCPLGQSKQAPLSINPESFDIAQDGEPVEPHTPTFKPESRRIDFRIQKVLELIGRNKTVLDLGCQDGSITKLIKQQNNLVYGIDISDEAIKLAKKSGIKSYKLDLEDKFPSSLYHRFNIVFAGEIIEHIYDTDKFLENIRAVLKDKGNLIITTPNIATFGRRLMLLFGQNPLLETRLGENNSGHIRYFTFKTLIKLLERHHFKITAKFSTVVNFDNQGRYQSRAIAMLFPTLGSTIIIKAVKNS